MNSKLLLVPVTALALILAAPGSAVADGGHKRVDDFEKASSSGKLHSQTKPRSVDANAKVNVMVQLAGDPVAVVQAKAGHQLSRSQRLQTKAKLRTAQKAITGDITKRGGTVVNTLQSAYNGIRVRIKESKASSLASLPGVIAVHTLVAKQLDNAVSVPYIGAPQAWQDSGKTGAGVKVAIIDTGIDYTHADFGGPGTAAAYEAAAATSTQPADPTLFGPNAPRVKGGYDFAGDDYDAATAGKDVPKPDSNPLDCEGHGSHVAGTAAGSGVTPDGKTYTGPYNKTTADTSFKVGPGVAPQADLYALRVFGCSGSTDLAVDAIDWAVDHGMNVINMSLGSPFGRSTDPDAVAASNAVAAGVVVVASSGNSGQSPYITGAPASGQGVISVAAVDSTATFPSASLKWDGTTMDAINANGADLPVGTFDIVVLGQGNDADPLGCSAADFTTAGIDPSKNQIAVVTRGSCARVAKAVYGQQAGAKAVLMINNDTGYPPYEGPITSNPDDGSAYTVTIPFLGVRSGDGAAIKAAAGQSLTMVKSTIDNPTYRQVADFSSSGPANGDSGLSPQVAAPGVSIASVAVGTGSDATVMSGTSMAAPHVAGVAALAVQAHPKWTASQIASAIVATADPQKVSGYSVTASGAGLVDPQQVVATQSLVTGDRYRTARGPVSEDSLSFGFAEPSSVYTATKTITVTNTGATPVTYTLSSVAAPQSRPASVRFSTRKVRVPARSSVRVAVTLSTSASTVGTSLGSDDQFSFRQISGDVVLTSASGELRVPYLLVPRAQAKVKAGLGGQTNIASLLPAQNGAKPAAAVFNANLRLTNYGGALSAYADVYTLGLTDKADVKGSGGSGYDLRAAGVQTIDTADGELLVFAVNTWSRWSNAAADEFDVGIDTNNDGKAEWTVFSADSGAIRTGDFTGETEVFLYNTTTKQLSATGFLAQAPTDSSTILLPVMASDLGLSADAGAFAYTVSSYTVEDSAAGDSFDAWAKYNPWQRAFEDGGGATVPRNGSASVQIAVNVANYLAQRPKGVMVAVVDNHSGPDEALLLGAR